MTDEWDEWRQEAAGIVVETAGVDTVAKKVEPTVEAEYADIPEERAITVTAPQQHLVVGVGALAAMGREDFERNLEMLTQGQERLAILTDRLLVKGQDYGHVPGISKPFLQKPGAEKLANFYGLAIRFEADRLIGDGKDSPQLTYHVRAYAHLKDFDGPVVAQGFGEANTWEERYRYVTQRPMCPSCGNTELVMRKSPPQLAGKLNCPTWQGKGGCNAVFEPNDPRVPKAGKVENPDVWGLANTLIKMAEKRSAVDCVLRATGTSGFFSQDDDSPSVRAQSSGAPDRGDDERPEVENVTGQQAVPRGGRPDAPTGTQMAQLSRLSKEKKLGPDGIAAVITRLFDVPVVLPDGTRGEQGKWLWGYIEQGMTADQLGRVLETLDTGEVPSAVPA